MLFTGDSLSINFMILDSFSAKIKGNRLGISSRESVVGGQGSDVRGRRSDVGGREGTEVRCRKSGIRERGGQFTQHYKTEKEATVNS